MTKAVLAPALGVALALLLSGCGSAAVTPTPTPVLSPMPTVGTRPIVGLVTDIGGLRDASFNQEAWAALQRAQRQLGVQAIVRESTAVTDYLPLLTQLARVRPRLIVAVGATMGTALYAAATQYPRQRFAIIDARPQSAPGTESNLPNVENIQFRQQESGFLVGVIAGLMERRRTRIARHNTIAWLGGEDIPPVNAYVAGFEAGARRVDPSISIVHDYAGSFGDPAAGRRYAARHVRLGADIVFQVAAATGAAYVRAAERRGRYGIGADANQSYLGPRTITSAVKRVDVAVYASIARALRGGFKPYDNWFGAAEGATGFAPPSGAVPKGVVARARAFQRLIARGVLRPPTKPTAR